MKAKSMFFFHLYICVMVRNNKQKLFGNYYKMQFSSLLKTSFPIELALFTPQAELFFLLCLRLRNSWWTGSIVLIASSWAFITIIWKYTWQSKWLKCKFFYNNLYQNIDRTWNGITWSIFCFISSVTFDALAASFNTLLHRSLKTLFSNATRFDGLHGWKNECCISLAASYQKQIRKCWKMVLNEKDFRHLWWKSNQPFLPLFEFLIHNFLQVDHSVYLVIIHFRR